MFVFEELGLDISRIIHEYRRWAEIFDARGGYLWEHKQKYCSVLIVLELLYGGIRTELNHKNPDITYKIGKGGPKENAYSLLTNIVFAYYGAGPVHAECGIVNNKLPKRKETDLYHIYKRYLNKEYPGNGMYCKPIKKKVDEQLNAMMKYFPELLA